MVHPLSAFLCQQVDRNGCRLGEVGAVHTHFGEAQYLVLTVAGDGESDIPSAGILSRQINQHRHRITAGQRLPYQRRLLK